MRRLFLLLMLTAGFALAQDRVFELRTYHCLPGKMGALKARFADHTIKIFQRHNMTSIGYWIPQDPALSNRLVYIIAHPSKEAADKNWAAFRADPDWVKAKAESEAAGPLVEKVESVYMSPAAFSPLK